MTQFNGHSRSLEPSAYLLRCNLSALGFLGGEKKLGTKVLLPPKKPQAPKLHLRKAK